jgi:RNA polymerase sigma-70 factor (ECF subfamily)
MEPFGSFEEFMRRIRGGDQSAAAELVRHYEPTIRRVIRFRLVDSRLGAVLDSMDICQSVLGSFFVRAASGQYDIAQPDDLVKLLVTMARNKLAGQARKERAGRRDNRRIQGGSSPEDLLADDPSPSEQVANQELLQQVQNRLTPEERRLVDLRSQGLDWAAIALELGENQVVLRKRLSRALDRVLRQLGLHEGNQD